MPLFNDQKNTFSVVTLGPVVTSTRLSKDKVVWAEQLTVWTGTDRVHGTWFQIDQNGTWNVLAASGFVEVDVHSLQLEVRVTVVGTGRVNAVFIRDDFPELILRTLVKDHLESQSYIHPLSIHTTSIQVNQIQVDQRAPLIFFLEEKENECGCVWMEDGDGG